MKQEFVTLPREVVEQVRGALAYVGAGNSSENPNLAQSTCRQAIWKLDHALRAALEQPDHSEQNLNMIPAGWKLAPVEPTVEMMDAGGAATRRCYQHLNKDEVMCSYVYRHMLAAAPQPPALEQQVEKESTCKESLQAEQEPVAYGLFRKDSSEIEWDADHVFSNEPWGVMYDDEEVRPLYTSPHPKREPLTHYEIHELFRRSWDYCQDGDEIKAFARAIEAAHNIK